MFLVYGVHPRIRREKCQISYFCNGHLAVVEPYEYKDGYVEVTKVFAISETGYSPQFNGHCAEGRYVLTPSQKSIEGECLGSEQTGYVLMVEIGSGTVTVSVVPPISQTDTDYKGLCGFNVPLKIKQSGNEDILLTLENIFSHPGLQFIQYGKVQVSAYFLQDGGKIRDEVDINLF